MASALLEREAGLKHLFLSRDAGDDPDWRGLGLPDAPVRVRQVHRDGIVVAGEGDMAGFRLQPAEGDVLITTVRRAPLAIFTADCVSAVIYDRATPALALVHAGWRGTARSIVWKTLLTMFERIGSRPEDCLAATGPAVAVSCYDVGEDVREAFVKALPYGQDVLTAHGDFRWLLDLGEANRRQLLDACIPADRVAVCPYCTRCEADWFHSARRGTEGRQATVAWLT